MEKTLDIQVLAVQCPTCFEWVELEIEADVTGSMVVDCEVCCHPMQVAVTCDEEGGPAVAARRLDD